MPSCGPERSLLPEAAIGAIAQLASAPIISPLVTADPMTFGAIREPDQASSVAPYIVEMGETDALHILHELQRFKALGVNGDEANRNHFELVPAVRDRLASAARNVHQGCGLSIIRGLNLSTFSPEDILAIFLGLSDHIGNVRGVQTRNGDMIAHITDSRAWTTPYSMRHGIHTNANLPFHTDMGADILALHVRACAEKGGDTYVASAGKIYCELVAHRPDVIETLSRPDWPIQISASPNRSIRVPLLEWHDGRVLMSLDPGRLGLHPNMARRSGAEAQTLTPAQREALSVVSSIATEHRLRLDTRPGDMVYINNWGLLHARDSYEDCTSESGPRRHLVRLWLRNSALGWKIPASMRIPWEAAFGPDGMGDKNPENGWRKSEYRGSGLFTRNYPVTPAPEYKPPKYTSGSAAFLLEYEHD